MSDHSKSEVAVTAVSAALSLLMSLKQPNPSWTDQGLNWLGTQQGQKVEVQNPNTSTNAPKKD